MVLNLDSVQLRELRDRLMGMGRPSLVPGVPPPESDASRVESLRRVQPFAELMFLIMASDREFHESEQAALRGAFRALTGRRFPSSVLDALVVDFRRALAEQGRDARLEDVCARLADDRQDAQGALTLAAAMSLADGALQPQELELLQQVAEWLRLSPARTSQLLDALNDDRSR